MLSIFDRKEPVKKTFDSIMSVFTKTIEELKQHEQEQIAESVRHAEVIRMATQDQSAALVEADKARKAVQKLSEMLE